MTDDIEASSSALEATGLGRKYRRGWALRDVAFRLSAGCVCALVGPNGSGKSTLLSLAADLLAPTTGTLRVFGHTPRRPRHAPASPSSPNGARLGVGPGGRRGGRRPVPAGDRQPAAGRAGRLDLPPRPAGPLLLGAAPERLARARRAVAGGLAVLSVAALLPYSVQLRTPQSRLDDPLAAARAVRELTRPGDGVLFLPARRREPIMSSPGDFRGLRELALARHAIPSGTLHGIELLAPAIRTRMLTAGRIVTVNDPPGQPLDDTPQERMKRAVLARYFHRCAVRDVTGMRIVLYARPGRC